MSQRQMPKPRNPRANKTRDYRKGSGDFPMMARPRYSRNVKHTRKEV